MADINRTETDAKGQLFDQIAQIKAGMLGVEGSGQHFQPMAPYADRDAGEIWFITSRDTDLAKAVVPGAKAHFTFIGEDRDYWACTMGEISQVEDREKLDELWNHMAAAWFAGGKDNPKITLLKLSLQSAEIWSATTNPLVFGLEIAMSNLREEKTPDIGEHTTVAWRMAA